MYTRLLAGAAALLTITSVVHAKTPGDVADLVGSRAPGAESQMQARGYVDVKNNTWWNASTNTCVRVHVSQGNYAGISQVKASTCGQGAGGATACPPDLSQADLSKHPGCSL
ncbi:hypothetical protein G3545_25890 [Starkeya sp. ORNL1]|uniref:hypothetical protein n=1 Tax=Starkeya sp. ORNL1 TaxID=2709380 RepID=UPI00146290CC|nr:hypothetical protein [Starkeya sp. ORNL1]QJP16770.1 hypothetical protein G3545_25890 [Starkeya sp. ORNL1]